MHTVHDRHCVGYIADASIGQIERNGQYVEIPVDPRDSFDNTRFVNIHTSQVRGLIGALRTLMEVSSR